MVEDRSHYLNLIWSCRPSVNAPRARSKGNKNNFRFFVLKQLQCSSFEFSHVIPTINQTILSYNYVIGHVTACLHTMAHIGHNGPNCPFVLYRYKTSITVLIYGLRTLMVVNNISHSSGWGQSKRIFRHLKLFWPCL